MGRDFSNGHIAPNFTYALPYEVLVGGERQGPFTGYFQFSEPVALQTVIRLAVELLEEVNREAHEGKDVMIVQGQVRYLQPDEVPKNAWIWQM